MSGPIDIDDLPPGERDAALAGEFALRLLAPAEEAACAAREASDPAFAAEVARWRAELGGLDDAFAPVPPPAGLKARIEARLFGAERAPSGAEPSALGRIWASVGLWRGLAAVATAVALWLAVPTAEEPLIAAMGPREGGGEFVASFDPEAGVITLTRLAGEPAEGRVFQLWALVDEAPVSLAVLPDTARAEVTLPPELAARLGDGTLVEVSEEPAGGSPTGGPTGTIFALGYLRDV